MLYSDEQARYLISPPSAKNQRLREYLRMLVILAIVGILVAASWAYQEHKRRQWREINHSIKEREEVLQKELRELP